MRRAVIAIDVDQVLTDLDFFARRHIDLVARATFMQAAAAIRAQRSRISSLTTEVDWWKRRHIRSEPMDPKVVDHLPAIR